MLKVNDSYEHEFTFTQEKVNKFIEISGDNNPIHYDEEYAKTTPFKKPIIHGILSTSIFSKVLGTLFPGEGSIYMMQQVDFLRPMYVAEKYKAFFSITETNPQKHIAFISTVIKNVATGKVTVKGIATIMNKEKI